MTTSAARVRAAVRSLGHDKVRVVGHDIGLMVAYAYAAAYRQDVLKLALMDAFLPGVAGWEAIYNSPAIWHFRFYGADTGGAGGGTRAALSRQPVERIRRRPPPLGVRGRPRRLHEGLRRSGPDGRGIRVLPVVPEDRRGIRGVRQDQTDDSRALDRRREIARRSARRAGAEPSAPTSRSSSSRTRATGSSKSVRTRRWRRSTAFFDDAT